MSERPCPDVFLCKRAVSIMVVDGLLSLSSGEAQWGWCTRSQENTWLQSSWPLRVWVKLGSECPQF